MFRDNPFSGRSKCLRASIVRLFSAELSVFRPLELVTVSLRPQGFTLPSRRVIVPQGGCLAARVFLSLCVTLGQMLQVNTTQSPVFSNHFSIVLASLPPWVSCCKSEPDPLPLIAPPSTFFFPSREFG